MEHFKGVMEEDMKDFGNKINKMDMLHIQHLKERKRKENGEMEGELYGAMHISAKINIHFHFLNILLLFQLNWNQLIIGLW